MLSEEVSTPSSACLRGAQDHQSVQGERKACGPHHGLLDWTIRTFEYLGADHFIANRLEMKDGKATGSSFDPSWRVREGWTDGR